MVDPRTLCRMRTAEAAVFRPRNALAPANHAYVSAQSTEKITSAHQVEVVSSVSERVWLARSKTDKMTEAKNEKAWKFKKTLPVKEALLLPLKQSLGNLSSSIKPLTHPQCRCVRRLV